MTIENLINIIGGEIINQPKVTKIESATIYYSKVDLGDLFFAMDNEHINKAVENGAYAIVYEGKTPEIKDNEIVYIKVDSIKEATIKFLRYIIVQKEAQIFYFEDIECSLLKQISYRKSTIFTILDNNWQKSFETILNSNYDIYVTTNIEDAKILSPKFKREKDLVNGYIVSDSLLKTTFRIEKYVYQDVEIAPFFVDNLRRVVSFCQNNHIDYDINRVKYTKEFKLYFVDKDLNIVQKGTTDRVLLFITTLKIIQKAINYLKHDGKWVKRITLTPPKTKLDSEDRPTWYENIDEAKNILKEQHYHYAFCYKLEPEEILQKGFDNPTLFE